MLIVQPMPEEFAAGHAGRCLVLNASHSSYLRPGPALTQFFSRSLDTREPSPIHAIARLCGLSVEDYAQRHTLMLFHSFASQAPAAERPQRWTAAQYKRFGMATLGQAARMCPTCISQDLATCGFSYWRRGHQCPGLVWCVEHRKPLREVDRPHAFLRSPADWIGMSTTVAGYTAKCPRVAMKRYHVTAEWMWKHGLPVPVKELNLALAAQAKLKGIINAAYSNDHRLLSDHAWSLFPVQWLHGTFPRAKNKVPGQKTTCLDAVLRVRQVDESGARGPQVGSAAIAMAISVLFNSPRELVQALQTATRKPRQGARSPVDSPRRTAFERRPEYAPTGGAMLARAYLDHAGDHKAIGRFLGLTEDEVRNKLARHRQSMLTQLRLTPEYAALQEFLAGKTQESVRKKYVITQPVFDAVLRLLHRKVNLPSTEAIPTRADRLRKARADRRYQQLKVELGHPEQAVARAA